jgi:hypothetical protein
VSGPKLTKPQSLDVIPATEVGALIEETDRVFVRLERELEIALAEADEAEALAAAEGVDPEASTWTMVRLQRFLDDLRVEAERDAAATIEVAQQRVRMELVDDASGATNPTLRAVTLVSGALPSTPPDLVAAPAARAPGPSSTSAAGPRPGPDEGPPNARDHTTGVADMPVVESAPVAVPVEQAMPAADARVAPDSSPPPARAFQATSPNSQTTNGNGPALDWSSRAPVAVASGPATIEHPAEQPASVLHDAFWEPAPTPSAVETVIPAPVFTPPAVPNPPTIAPPEPEYIPEPAKGKRKKKHKPPKPPKHSQGSVLRRLPVAAILEVVAVLLILVFILLRLS